MNGRIITAMETMILFVALVFALGMAVLGGLGVGGMGVDSRNLDPRQHSDERPWRFLL